MICVGVDPGSKTSGVVLRDGGKVREWELIEREVGESIDHYAHVVALVANGWAADLVAVEGLRPMGAIHRVPLIETAIVLGWVMARSRHYVMVPPNLHGKGPLLSYPRSIVGDTEIRGTGKLRHARAAYDIAGWAMLDAEAAAALRAGGLSA